MQSPLRTLLLSFVLCAASTLAQESKAVSPLTSLVNAELAFARTSAEHGMDSAFIAFLADDAIIFRPHPVNGQDWFRAHPAPPILLTWTPGFADVSITGDLGYTTGPWMARDKADTTAAPAYGDFVTVWKRKREGWKVTMDLGVSHPAPASDVHFSAPKNERGGSPLVRPDSGFRAAEWSKLLAVEQRSLGDSLHAVPVTNLVTLLNPEARIFRPGHFPLVGPDSVTKSSDSQPGTFFRHHFGGDLSRGGDLAYTYGAYRYREKDAKEEREGYYLTVWKKEGKGNWNIVLDLESNLPKKRQ